MAKPMLSPQRILGRDYLKMIKRIELIKVWFSTEGGGEDFDDQCMLLESVKETSLCGFHCLTSYHTDGGGFDGEN